MYRSVGEGIAGGLQQVLAYAWEDKLWAERRKVMREEALAAREQELADRQEQREYDRSIAVQDEEIAERRAREKAEADAAVAAATEAGKNKRHELSERGKMERARIRGAGEAPAAATRLEIQADPDSTTGYVYFDPSKNEVVYDDETGLAREAPAPYRERQGSSQQRAKDAVARAIADPIGTFKRAFTGEKQGRRRKDRPAMAQKAAPAAAPAPPADEPVEIKTDKTGKRWKIYADGTMEPAE